MAYTIKLTPSDSSDELYHYGILGMKWGRRKARRNTFSGSNKNNKDPKINLMNSSRSAVNESRNLNNSIGNVKKRNTKRMDLKSMSDQEMRNRINRELLERQYDDIFNPKKVQKGRKKVDDILSIAGPVVGIASSALGIALSIQSLRNKR